MDYVMPFEESWTRYSCGCAAYSGCDSSCGDLHCNWEHACKAHSTLQRPPDTAYEVFDYPEAFYDLEPCPAANEAADNPSYNEGR